MSNLITMVNLKRHTRVYSIFLIAFFSKNPKCGYRSMIHIPPANRLCVEEDNKKYEVRLKRALISDVDGDDDAIRKIQVIII
jgi:hypothetical protein